MLPSVALLCSFEEHQYFLDHTDYDATASSTLAAQGKHNYDVVNIKGDPTREVQSPWAEGVEGDGIGESITLNVKRPLATLWHPDSAWILRLRQRRNRG